MTSVFISSTSKDLLEYRKAAIAICNQLKFVPIAMENFPAIPKSATSGSLSKIDEADLFVLIVAHRYGYIGENEEQSVTEAEYHYAGDQRRLDRLCFLINPAYPWPPNMVERGKKWEKLEAFKNNIEKSLIRAYFTSVEDFSHQLMHALIDWRDNHLGAYHADTLSARIVTSYQNIPELPSEFIGRESLIAQIDTLLDNNKRVLLHGIGGIGKTALAATIGSRRVQAGKGPALWLRVGDYGSDDLFQALAKPFNRQMEIVTQRGQARQNTMNGLLKDDIKLLILDDASPNRGQELKEVLDSVPQSIPVLITSQYKHGVVLDIILVSRLNLEESLELLSHYARRDWSKDAQARELCKRFGGLPFALRLAGRAIDVDDISPLDYLNRIKDMLDPKTPGDTPWLGDEIQYSWIEPNLQSLDETAREIFSHFGAFFAPGATQELLLRYMKHIKEGDTNEYRIRVRKALAELQRRDLVQQRRVEEVTDENLRYYSMHNLVYAYAQYLNQQQSDERHFKALEACLTYTRRFNADSAEDRRALRLELDNFLGAAKWAKQVGRYTDVQEFVRNLYDGSQLLQKEGFYEQTTELLSLAIEAAQRNRGVYLSNQGRMYRDLGNYAEALKAFEAALETYREIKSWEPETEDRLIPDIDSSASEGVILGYLGLTYSDLGDNENAILYCDQALYIADELENKYKKPDLRISDIQRVGNLGLSHAYRNRGKYETAKEHLKTAIGIVETIGDRGRVSRYKSYQGLIYAYLGKLNDAIHCCQEGLAISENMQQDDRGKKRAGCANRGYLGIFYLDVGNLDEALRNSEEALKIAREIVDRRSEGNRLGDLGQAYLCLGDYRKARQYHEEGLSIIRQIGAKRSEGYRLAGLIETYIAIGDFDGTFDDYLRDLQRMLNEPDPYPRDQHYWGATIVQALLLHNPEPDSGHALAVLEKTLSFEDHTRGHFTHALYGTVLARQNRRNEATSAFWKAIERSDGLLTLTPQYFSANYTKGHAYSGLAVLAEDKEQYQEYLEKALAAFWEARDNCDTKGALEGALRILGELPDDKYRLVRILEFLKNPSSAAG